MATTKVMTDWWLQTVTNEVSAVVYSTCPPYFRPMWSVMQKSPHFLTHWRSGVGVDVAGFISQSQGLPAYACKTDSSTAIKLAPRMHQSLPFWAPKLKNNSGEGASLGLSSSGEGDTFSPHPLIGTDTDRHNGPACTDSAVKTLHADCQRPGVQDSVATTSESVWRYSSVSG